MHKISGVRIVSPALEPLCVGSQFGRLENYSGGVLTQFSIREDDLKRAYGDSAPHKPLGSLLARIKSNGGTPLSQFDLHGEAWRMLGGYRGWHRMTAITLSCSSNR